jgi:hypothetical protein
MSDTGAIAAAIAARFSSGVTPPAGQPAIVQATAQLPTGSGGGLPAVFVFPPEESIELDSFTRIAVQLYPLRFLLVAEPSDPTDITALHAWHGVIQDRILTNFQLGRAGEVAVAWIASIKPGVITYAAQDYLGLDMVVSVTVSEPISPVA